LSRTKRISTDSTLAHLKLRRAIAWPEYAALPEDPDAREEVLGFFAAIIQSRSESDWSVAELLMVSNLANVQHMIGIAMRDVYERGLVVEKAGSKNQIVSITNPSADALNRMLSLAGSLASKLSLPAATGAGRVSKTSLHHHAAADPAHFETAPHEAPRLWRDRPQ